MDKSDTVIIFPVQLSGLDTSYLRSKSSFQFFALIPWNGLDTFHNWPTITSSCGHGGRENGLLHSIGTHESGIDSTNTSVE